MIGWPLLWTASLLRFPRWHELTVDDAYPYALGLSLAANAVAVVATAYIGRWSTNRRSVGLVAAGLLATWPIWVGIIAGEQAWENGQWYADTGLLLYTEPLSTALVAGGAALLAPNVSEARGAAAGIAIGYSVVEKLTNGLLAAAWLPLLAVRHGVRRAVPYALGCLLSAPIVVAYWPKGYVAIYGGDVAPVDRPWSLDYVRLNWEHSTLFTPALLVLLGVPAAVGVRFVRGWYARLVLVLPIVLTAATYSVYYVTYQHPRFLFVTLPFVFVLVAAAVVVAVTAAWQHGAAAAGPGAPDGRGTSEVA